MNLISVSRVQRNPTVKTEIKMRNFEANIPSVSSAILWVRLPTSPLSRLQPCLPVRTRAYAGGVTRELVRRFNQTYAPVLVEPEILLPEIACCRRLPGTDGKKMSRVSATVSTWATMRRPFGRRWRRCLTVSHVWAWKSRDIWRAMPCSLILRHSLHLRTFAEFWPEFKTLDELKEQYVKVVSVTVPARSSWTASSTRCSTQSVPAVMSLSRIFLRYSISWRRVAGCPRSLQPDYGWGSQGYAYRLFQRCCLYWEQAAKFKFSL